MPEQRQLWPLLAYGTLSVVAFARRGGLRPGRPRGEGGRTRERNRGFTAEPANALRAQEHGRGRRATAPWDIPWRGWKDIFWRTYGKIDDNRLLAVAAGVVFYSLLALFPAIVSAMSGILPGGAVDILHKELTRLTANKGGNLSIGFIVSLLFALWSANAGMKAIIDALNVAYGETEKRSFIRLNLASLLYTLVAMASLMLAIGAVVVAPIVLQTLGLGGVAGTLIAYARWSALLVLVIVMLAAAYRYLPCRREPRWEWLTPGSSVAAVGWFVSSLLFSWYIANFGNNNVTYGSLGAAVGVMMWMWISMVVILIGAQLNAEIEHQIARDSTAEREKPPGQRGAVKADTIGAAQS